LLRLRRRHNKRQQRGEKNERPKHIFVPSDFIVAPKAFGECALWSIAQTLRQRYAPIKPSCLEHADAAAQNGIAGGPKVDKEWAINPLLAACRTEV
jgi:hypothetical protein